MIVVQWHRLILYALRKIYICLTLSTISRLLPFISYYFPFLNAVMEGVLELCKLQGESGRSPVAELDLDYNPKSEYFWQL